MSKPDGGLAFPVPTEAKPDVYGTPTFRIGSTGGMSLRDWFAGQALAGFASRYEPGLLTMDEAENVGIACDMLADALLKERDK